MEDAWIGKVLFAGIVGLVLWGVTALIQSKSETAKRARIVIGGALILAVAWAVFMAAGPVGFIITLAVIGAGAWIVNGKTK